MRAEVSLPADRRDRLIEKLGEVFLAVAQGPDLARDVEARQGAGDDRPRTRVGRTTARHAQARLDVRREELLPPQLLLEMAGPQRWGPVEHLRDLEVSLGLVPGGAGERLEGGTQSLPGGLARRPGFQGVPYGQPRLDEAAEDDVLLRTEVAEQRAAGDAGLVRDLRHRRGVEALLEEQAHGHVADLGLHRPPGALPYPRRSSIHGTQ